MEQLTSILRPRRLEEFVGNGKVLDLIKKNLIKNDFAHTVIFYGKNGTGKSSLAEYVAQSLACMNNKDSNSYNPCGVCEVCKSAIQTNFEAVKGIKKVDMTLVSKQNISDVIKEIFIFEGEAPKSIFILEEMQALNRDQQSVFLEHLAKVPEDVYVFITTDRLGSGIIPPLKNRSIPIELKNPNFKEAFDFFNVKCNELGIEVKNMNISKNFVKSCNNNPRSIITHLEMFRNLGEITQVGLESLFDLKGDVAQIMWKKLFDKTTTLEDFVTWLKETQETESILQIFNTVKWIAVENLMINETSIECELSTVEKGEIRKIISEVSLNTYEKCLKILEEECRDDTHAISTLVRCKIRATVNETKENERVSVSKMSSMQSTSYAKKYGLQ